MSTATVTPIRTRTVTIGLDPYDLPEQAATVLEAVESMRVFAGGTLDQLGAVLLHRPDGQPYDGPAIAEHLDTIDDLIPYVSSGVPEEATPAMVQARIVEEAEAILALLGVAA